MSVFFSAGMLLALSWIAGRDTRGLPAASALFGLAVLAKGLGPVAIALPLVRGRHLVDWLKPRVLLPFFVVALPWYALCYWRNGWTFIHEFFVVHTLGRLASKELAHGQPWWYYLPILVGALLPWTPLLGLLARRKGYEDPRRQFLLGWFLFTVVFFSVMLNKLSGYILPALPAAAALAGIALDEVDRARGWLASCALLVVAFPIAAQVLPASVVAGRGGGGDSGVVAGGARAQAGGSAGDRDRRGAGYRVAEGGCHAGVGAGGLGARIVAAGRRAGGRSLPG
jgi:4-amino-4-deoxy-L-arabinose transferase-like glycosyltransferase